MTVSASEFILMATSLHELQFLILEDGPLEINCEWAVNIHLHTSQSYYHHPVISVCVYQPMEDAIGWECMADLLASVFRPSRHVKMMMSLLLERREKFVGNCFFNIFFL